MTEPAPPLLRWEAPGPYAVAFSTRAGGVSEGPFASLNLGLLTDDALGRVEENRRRLCAAVGADAGAIAMNRQVHGATVRRARAGDRGRPGDGLWTDEPGVSVLALGADCLPVVLARTNGRPALAVLHVGRAGVLAGIVEAGVAALGRGRLAAAVGPGIGPCCYEVGEEVAGPLRAAYGADVAANGTADLWTATARALERAGVERVERLDLCTACRPDLFFSHRRDAGETGRQGVIGLVV
ncbi:MAG: polyphenol oxidase family protein [Gaiellaceae bacterium]